MSDFSYQLYSSRNFSPLSDTLKMLADAGYASVEGYGAMFSDQVDLGVLKADIEAAGLTMPTAHIGLDIIRDRPARAIEIAGALGVQGVFAPYLPEAERPVAPDGWVAFGEMLGEAAKPLWDAGLIFGWHNHAFEFEPVEGILPIDLILSASDALRIELDVAWCIKGGTEPLSWIEAHGARIVAAHVKDIAPQGQALDEDGWADVGHGTMDWPAIMGALRRTSCGWFIAEHDNPSDDTRFAARSLAAMRGFGEAKG